MKNVSKDQLTKIVRLTAYSICDTCKYGETDYECNRECKKEYVASDKFRRKANKLLEEKWTKKLNRYVMH